MVELLKYELSSVHGAKVKGMLGKAFGGYTLCIKTCSPQWVEVGLGYNLELV